MNVFFIRYEHFQPLWIFFLLLCFFISRKSFFNCLDFLVALNLFFNCWIQFLIVATFLVVVNFSLFFVNLLDCCKCAFNLLRLFSFVVAVVDHCTLVAKMLCKLIVYFFSGKIETNSVKLYYIVLFRQKILYTIFIVKLNLLPLFSAASRI